MALNKKNIVVFDLDDTLYKEIDFLKSAFHEISNYLASILNIDETIIFETMMQYYAHNFNVFKEIINRYNLKTVSVAQLMSIYRNHIPKIELDNSTITVLESIKRISYKVGLITDGRSVQQRNKICALGLSDYFDDIIISEEFGFEKPNINNFKYFEEKYGPDYTYVYVGDNVKKDFIAPNRLGWITICLLDNGENIHKQTFELDINFLPKQLVTDLLKIEGN